MEQIWHNICLTLFERAHDYKASFAMIDQMSLITITVYNERSNVFESADEDIVSIHCKLRCNQRLVLKGAGFHLPSNLLELKLDSHQAVCLKRSSA